VNDDIETIRYWLPDFPDDFAFEPELIADADAGDPHAALDHLEAELNTANLANEAHLNLRKKVEAEVEGLREELKEADAAYELLRARARQEVERLRSLRTESSLYQEIRALERTQKELRAENEGLRDTRDKMFEKNALQRHRNDLTEAENERLRGHMERQQEQLRRLRRIEEAARGVMGLYNVDKEYGIDAMSPEWGRLRNAWRDKP